MSGFWTRHVSVAATVACAVLLGIFLLRGHASGGEVLGPIAAVVGIAAGGLSLVAERSPGRRLALVTIVVLWTTVIFLGVAGSFDHAKPVMPGYTDQRPRPAYVPLVFSLIGGAAIAAAVRAPGREARVAADDEVHR